jgi:predicted enzyme related to lactoylglutathione lyase
VIINVSFATVGFFYACLLKGELMPRVIHFEIHATDPDAITKFYSELFGWKITKFDGMDYWLIDTGEKSQPGIDGGIVKRMGKPAEFGQGVNAYVCVIDVDSIDNSLEKALSLGATIAVPIMPVPGVGSLAYVKDPDGNILGMLQPESPTA